MKKSAFTGLRSLCWAVPLCLGAGAALAQEEGENFAPIEPTTKAECSACHNAYPAELLPAASWNQILDNLGNHFGEDASLKPDQVATIRAYLTKHAMQSAKGVDMANPPIRITEFPWYTRIHGPRLAARAKANPSIGTLSNCSGCHQGL